MSPSSANPTPDDDVSPKLRRSDGSSPAEDMDDDLSPFLSNNSQEAGQNNNSLPNSSPEEFFGNQEENPIGFNVNPDNEFFNQFDIEEKSWFNRTFIQRPGNLILALLYITFFAGIVSLVLYSFLGHVPTQEEVIASRPSVSINPNTIKIIREDDTVAQPNASEAVTPPQTEVAQAETSNQAEDNIQNADQSNLAEDTPTEGSNQTDSVDAVNNTAESEIKTVTEIPVSEQVKEVKALTGYGVTPETALIKGDIKDDYANKLAVAPVASVTMKAEIGDLPIISADQQMPFNVYARPTVIPNGFVPIAVVMLNLGLNAQMNELALKLPGAVTLGFLPQAKNLQDWVTRSRALGHEITLFLPIQPNNYPESDAGPNGLTLDVEMDVNIENLHWVMSRFSGYSSLYINAGTMFSRYPDRSMAIIDDIRGRGLALTSLSSTDEDMVKVFETAGLKTAKFDLILDQALTRASFLEKMLAAEVQAQTQQDLIIGVSALPNNVQRIREWSEDLGKRRIVLVPLSALIERRTIQKK